MTTIPNGEGSLDRVLLLGGTSEIGLAILSAIGPGPGPGHAVGSGHAVGPGTEVIFAGRDPRRLEMAAKSLNLPGTVTVAGYDAMDTASHQAFADEVCAGGVPDLVIAAAGVLFPQREAERDVSLAATMIETNFTGHVTTLLALGEHMRDRGSGTIVVLSSVAAVRPRKFNPVYGAAKAGLDSFARGFADELHGTGVRVLLVRPGFVTGRMTAGMRSAPMATTPDAVGAAVAAALRGSRSTVWIPATLAGLATAMRLVPRPLWRRIDR